jgi:uncharacterized protein DUF2604
MTQATLEAGKDAGHHNPNTFNVFVVYNGVEKELTVNANQTVQALLNHAIQEFHITSQPHILSLFNESGLELPETAKVSETGIGPGSRLLLRPSRVKGGER